MDYDQLKAQRTAIKGQLTRLKNWLDVEADRELRVKHFEARSKTALDYLNKYNHIQDNIEAVPEYADQDNENRAVFESYAFEIIVTLDECIEKLKKPISTALNSNQASVVQVPPLHPAIKLPEVKIQTFNGKIEEWQPFCQLFNTLITDNPSLSDIQKLIYLKSYVRDEPLQLIESLQVTHSNFNIALNVLKNRYENRLSIINSHFDALLSISPITKCTAVSLRKFHTDVKKQMDLIRNLKYSEKELWDFLLVYIFEKKLDFNSRKSFEDFKDPTTLPTMNLLMEFLNNRCFKFENLSATDFFTPSPQKKLSKVNLHANTQKGRNEGNSNTFSIYTCVFCQNKSHRIYVCDKFKELPFNEKQKFVNRERLCFNCLGKGHMINQCKAGGCRTCSRKHHTLLHTGPKVDGAKSSNATCSHQSGNSSNADVIQKAITNHPGSGRIIHTSSDNIQNVGGNFAPNDSSPICSVVFSEPPQALSATHQSSAGNETNVLLSTACVEIFDKDGMPISAIALLDCGSQCSFIQSKLVNKLGLATRPSRLSISGINLSSLASNTVTDLVIHSKAYEKSFPLTCIILDKITCKLPQLPIDMSKLQIPPGLPLSNKNFGVPSEIQLLIGADLYFELLLNDVRSLGPRKPSLLGTWLGYTIAGVVPVKGTHHFASLVSTGNDERNVSLFVNARDDSSLDSLLEQFWEIEGIEGKPMLTPDEISADKIFDSTTKILKNGSFQVDLPLKQKPDVLGNSFHVAKKRFENLEKRFKSDGNYFKEYKSFIQEYLNLDHARIIPLLYQNAEGLSKYFIPHFAVLRPDSTSTQLRVVFDASTPTSSKLSLNQITYKGYQVQPNLFDILVRFRTYPYVLTCDIQKAYRQIRINPDQTFLLNILWRDSPDDQLQCLELQTVTYGTAPASYLCTKVLNEIGLLNQDTFPLASGALLTQCYVDDILGGADGAEQLNQFYIELTTLLGKHGFPLHKWCSNDNAFLKQLAIDNILEYNFNLNNKPSKVLGLKWQSSEDMLAISIPTVPLNQNCTKRTILSAISQCFDPLGLLAPVIVIGKFIMQELWKVKIDWDSILKDETVVTLWKDFISHLPVLADLKIPRYSFLHNKKIKSTQIHGFADASMRAFAACVYIRAEYDDGSISVNLITARSRVAPLRTVSLPRLELCAMVLLGKLIRSVSEILKCRVTPQSTNLWTDSQVALHWISSHASRWNVFVANRVSQVQELTQNCTWRHISSGENPADLPSRGVPPHEIISCKLWWEGPTFLHNPNLDMDRLENKLEIIEAPEERKTAHVSVTKTNNDEFWNDLFSRFSNFTSLQRTMVFILRFAYNTSCPGQKRSGTVSVNELHRALIKIVQALQSQHFSKDLDDLSLGRPLKEKYLLSLNPFLDENGLIRVGGRLENAAVSYDQKHPILLPSRNRIVSLMLKKEHIRLGHAGAHNVLSNFRLRFWPINGLKDVKRIIRECRVCFRFQMKPAQQLMADLPRSRVNMGRPFHHTGVDYGGPFLVKSSQLRKAPVTKAYLALFVCLSTKAVHLELVNGLSTNEFLAAFKRFIARRGNPVRISSDNGTNFVGAANQLRELYLFLRKKEIKEEVQSFLASNEIDFSFIPPRSPHWGGIWETAIKSAKSHLKRLVGDAHLTFEELYTVLTQIEAILNSRPLCGLSNDPNDVEALTPGHFLIGTSLTAFPDKDVTDLPLNRLTRWQHMAQIQQGFWKRWRVDYLNQLQTRAKWSKTQSNLNINDLVLIGEDNVPPLQWPLARVAEVFPGRDGRVRAVKLKTKDGLFVRNITKLYPLPLSCDES